MVHSEFVGGEFALTEFRFEFFLIMKYEDESDNDNNRIHHECCVYLFLFSFNNLKYQIYDQNFDIYFLFCTLFLKYM